MLYSPHDFKSFKIILKIIGKKYKGITIKKYLTWAKKITSIKKVKETISLGKTSNKNIIRKIKLN